MLLLIVKYHLTDTPWGYRMRLGNIPLRGMWDKEEIMSEESVKCPACEGKKKDRSEEEKRNLINRLSRIEGQIRGVKRMIEEDAYCVDILRQSAAAGAALNSFDKIILSRHIKSCVIENVRSGKDEVIDELVDTIQKMLK